MTSRDPKMSEQGDASNKKTPEPTYPGPSAFLVENEGTPENTEMDPDDPEPAAEGGIRTECRAATVQEQEPKKKNYL